MPVSDTCIYFIIAILGLAYPISLTVVTRLDDKYKSAIIVRRFQRSFAFRSFQGLLIAAIVLAAIQVFWIINYKPLPGEHLAYRITDWAEVSLCIVTGLLLISFFLFTYMVFQFYVPSSLVNWLRKDDDDKEKLNFKSLTALLYAGIDVSDDRLVKTITAHFNQLFKQRRAEAGNELVKYPVEYYELVYDAIFRSSKSDYWKIQHVGYSAASGFWLIGSHEYTHIDELTYAWLWNNLRLMMELEKDDYIEQFWHNSHELITSGLGSVPWRHDDENPVIILNRAEADQRESERARFFEFHTALGGMLLYGKRYALIKRLFNHTTSIPFRYELLPMTMRQVLDLFFTFWTADGLFYIGKYQFPGITGIQAEFLSKEYIARYTALLFVRQYFLVSQWYGYEPVSMPQMPSTQDERSLWLQKLPYFKKLVDDIENNKALMDALGYEKISTEWSELHHKQQPGNLIDKLLTQINAAYAGAEVEQQAEASKKQAFRESSGLVINARINSYANIINPAPPTEGFSSSRIKGGYMLYKKAAFAADQDTTYLNYDTFFAREIAAGITRELTALFKSKSERTFLFRAPELFEAIDRMHLRADQHVLVNFGISMEWVAQQHGTERLTEASYKGIPILKVEFTDASVLRDSLIVMRRSDLPWFSFETPEATEIQKFQLVQVSENHRLYANVQDINEHAELRNLFPNVKQETLNTSVVLSIGLNMDVRWHNQAKLVRLALYSEFYQQGTPNDLSEITRF